MRMNAHRKIHSLWLRLMAGLCCVMLLTSLFAVASADLGRYLEPDRETALTIRYHTENVTFRLYRVADVDETIEFIPVSPFDGYRIDIRRDMTASEWQTLADTLANYAAADNLPPMEVRLTDSDGEIRFNGLEAGLYLVVGQGYDVGEEIYTITPTLISLPNMQEDGWWQYDVEISPKWSVRPIVREDLQVVKVWKDEGSGVSRPASVTVELYCDGVRYDVAVLSKANNWRHTWTGLDTRNTWSVVERGVSSAYRVSISRQGNTVVVTNSTYTPPTSTRVPDLPQTGQTWWPVPVLAVAGMLLFVLGWLKQRQDET